MSGFILKVAVVAASVIAFLMATKAHGRQLRLERQLAGYWDVTFGAQNPPFVEALWWRERIVVWSIAIALAVMAMGYVYVARQRGWPLPLAETGWLAVLWTVLAAPAVLAFTVSGFASAARFASQLSRMASSPEWVPRAVAGSVAWWVATVGIAAAVAVLAFRGAAERA
jgi:urea transporter